MQRTDLIIAAVIGVSLLAGVTAAAEQPERLSAAEQFQSQIEPFVKQYCADCHNDADREGDLSLASISHDFRDAQQTATWSGMLDMLELGEMPPKEAKQPPGKEQALVMDWIRIELGHAGVERDATLLARPEYGNYVDHDKLFDGSVTEKPYTMPRLWRVRSENYPITPPPVSDEGADYAALREADEPTAQRLMALSEEIGKVLTAHVLGEEGINPHRTLGRQLRRANVYHRLIEDAEVYTNDQPLSRELVVVDVGTLFER
ncbi:MAG: c-type cytochrome domain-containing protein, partial [Pirellulales bacterium]